MSDEGYSAPPRASEGPSDEAVERAREIEQNAEMEVSEDELAWAAEILSEAGR